MVREFTFLRAHDVSLSFRQNIIVLRIQVQLSETELEHGLIHFHIEIFGARAVCILWHLVRSFSVGASTHQQLFEALADLRLLLMADIGARVVVHALRLDRRRNRVRIHLISICQVG